MSKGVNDAQVRKAEAEADKKEAEARYWKLRVQILSGAYVRKERVEELEGFLANIECSTESTLRTVQKEDVTIKSGAVFFAMKLTELHCTFILAVIRESRKRDTGPQ